MGENHPALAQGNELADELAKPVATKMQRTFKNDMDALRTSHAQTVGMQKLILAISKAAVPRGRLPGQDDEADDGPPPDDDPGGYYPTGCRHIATFAAIPRPPLALRGTSNWGPRLIERCAAWLVGLRRPTHETRPSPLIQEFHTVRADCIDFELTSGYRMPICQGMQ